MNWAASSAPRQILVADDDDLNRDFLATLLESEGHEVVTAKDGEEALRVFKDRHLDLALLDVLMPGYTGFSVCRRVKSEPETRLIPVVLVTGLSNVSDRVLGIEAGADDFLSKPVHREELLARVRSLLKLKGFVDELEQAETVLFSLALGIEAKDPYTDGHCQRLSEYSVALGKRIGLNEEQLTALRRGGIVHDIGKLGVPEYILQKPGPLTAQERQIMEQHPVIGEKICAPLKSFRPVLPIIRHHHEKLDGSGYPDGLRGSEIPLTAKVLTTVDVYDALTTDRPYRQALPPPEAIEIIWQEVQRGWWEGDLVRELERLVLPAGGVEERQEAACESR
jgi:putative two-component system response regulator